LWHTSCLQLQQIGGRLTTHANVEAITWNEFKARFRTHYVPRGTLKLKKKEFSELDQGNMMVNEYLNQFIQLSTYATDDVNIDEKKQDMFLKGLKDDIQFQLLNTDYSDFQHLVDKAIIIDNKLNEMEKDGKRKMSFSGQHSGSNTKPHFSQPSQFVRAPFPNRAPMQVPHPQFQNQQSQFPMQHPNFQTQRSGYPMFHPQHQAVCPIV
jgi:hypothetical protein